MYTSWLYLFCIIIGCGPVGLLAIGIAKEMGATKMLEEQQKTLMHFFLLTNPLFQLSVLIIAALQQI